MPKFRKKPVVIDAVQFTGGAKAATPIIDWVMAGGGTARWKEGEPPLDLGGCGHSGWPENIRIETLEGTMYAIVGDWIIRSVQGQFYTCKPEIFAATYDPA